MPHWGEMLAAYALAVGVLALAGAAWALSRSAPARLKSDVAECVSVVNGIEATWRKERAALAEYLEEIQRVLDSVERKRRQVSSAASRLDRANGGEPELAQMSPEQMREHFTRVARQRGLL